MAPSAVPVPRVERYDHEESMAGHIIITDLDEKAALKLARDVARELDYNVERTDEFTFHATKGNLALSIIVGAFVAYCYFTIEINPGKYAGEVEIIINRNSPWWTGVLGVNRVKKRAKELAEEIADAIEKDGGKVVREKDF
jgi:hypothetical protein